MYSQHHSFWLHVMLLVAREVVLFHNCFAHVDYIIVLLLIVGVRRDVLSFSLCLSAHLWGH